MTVLQHTRSSYFLSARGEQKLRYLSPSPFDAPFLVNLYPAVPELQESCLSSECPAISLEASLFLTFSINEYLLILELEKLQTERCLLQTMLQLPVGTCSPRTGHHRTYSRTSFHIRKWYVLHIPALHLSATCTDIVGIFQASAKAQDSYI